MTVFAGSFGSPGTNTLYVYTQDEIGNSPSGIQHKAIINFDHCNPDEELVPIEGELEAYRKSMMCYSNPNWWRNDST